MKVFYEDMGCGQSTNSSVGPNDKSKADEKEKADSVEEIKVQVKKKTTINTAKCEVLAENHGELNYSGNISKPLWPDMNTCTTRSDGFFCNENSKQPVAKVSSGNAVKATGSQIEFFKMLDAKIERGRDYGSIHSVDRES